MPLIDPPPPPNRRALGSAALATLGAVLLILGAREATTKAAAASLATTEQTPPLPTLPAAIACVFGVCADETAATAALTGQSSWCHWGSSRPQFGTGSELDARLWLASAETGYAEQPPDDDGDAPCCPAVVTRLTYHHVSQTKSMLARAAAALDRCGGSLLVVIEQRPCGGGGECREASALCGPLACSPGEPRRADLAPWDCCASRLFKPGQFEASTWNPAVSAAHSADASAVVEQVVGTSGGSLFGLDNATAPLREWPWVPDGYAAVFRRL